MLPRYCHGDFPSSCEIGTQTSSCDAVEEYLGFLDILTSRGLLRT